MKSPDKAGNTRNRLTSEWEDDVAGRMRRIASHAKWLEENNAQQLECDRAVLVKQYRANSRVWPDGIDSGSDRWYGDGKAWSEARIERALAEQSVSKPVSSEVVSSGSVSSPVTIVTANVSVQTDRKAYMRELMRRKRAKGKTEK